LLTSSIHNTHHSVPFQAVVFAGHTNTGGGATCQCGCARCICDPGESPSDCVNPNRVGSPAADGAADRIAAPKGKGGHSGLDYGSSALMLVMALWLWARLRA
jgi:hypothetical protein